MDGLPTKTRSPFLPMKTILIVILLACAFSGGACSRSEKQPDTAAQTTPSPNLKSDAERLQRATAKAAEERKRADAAATPVTALPAGVGRRGTPIFDAATLAAKKKKKKKNQGFLV